MNECLFTREFIIIYTYTSSIIIYLILDLFFCLYSSHTDSI